MKKSNPVAAKHERTGKCVSPNTPTVHVAVWGGSHTSTPTHKHRGSHNRECNRTGAVCSSHTHVAKQCQPNSRSHFFQNAGTFYGRRRTSGNETQPRFPSVHAGERGGQKQRLRRGTRLNRREARPPQTNERSVRRPSRETERALPAPEKRETKEKAQTGGRGVRGAVSARHRRCGQLAAKKEENRRGLGALPRAPSTKSAEEEEGEKGQWEGPTQAGVAEMRRCWGTPGGSPLTS